MGAFGRRAFVALALLASLALAACAHGVRLTERPANAEVRALHYTEPELAVSTVVAGVEQPVARGVSVIGRFWADRVVADIPDLAAPIGSGEDHDHHDHGDHAHHDPSQVDSVSSASKIVAGGQAADEVRLDGLFGVRVQGEAGDVPFDARVIGRVSDEPDYFSMSLTALGTLELAKRNFVLSGYFGQARDRVSPLEAPPEQPGLWPAEHQRLYAGLLASQVLTTRLVVSGGAEITQQAGELSNPYRRVAVKSPRASPSAYPSYFPERMPGERMRLSGFVGAAAYLGLQTALHLRGGFYADDWSIQALLPEAAVVSELTPSVLLTLTYRYIGQRGAAFHRHVFPDRNMVDPRTSDPRLGPLTDHTLTLESRFTLAGRAEEAKSLDLIMLYFVSLLDYRDIARAVNVSHVLSAGLVARY